MTTYVYRSTCERWRYLFADTADELSLMVTIVGDPPRNPVMLTWTCHDVTEDQLQLAVACGAKPMDKLDVRNWYRRRLIASPE